MTELVAKAASILRASTDLDDDAVIEQLGQDGIERRVAERLVTFLPMAYARHLQTLGARLQDHYESVLPHGYIERVELSSEPFFRASMQFYHSEIAQGMSGADLLAIAARSAEFDAANQALNSGYSLSQAAFGPCRIQWEADDSEQSFATNGKKI